ncbi:MAG: Hsp20/alpha crystallin family protein [Ignavibacteriales bacterium]|nr:Hsp20/alpha crystallin family protein [Ignavibacteriales bacterium]
MLVRYKTFPSLFNEIDELFAPTYPLFNRVRFVEPTRGVQVKDSGDAVNVVVELPGVTKEDVKVTLHDGVLSVVAERKQPELKENEQWVRNEISYGKFERSINLPYPVVAEKIAASHENGMLRITLPKAEEAKPKQISIR